MTIDEALPGACILGLAAFGVVVLLPELLAWVLFLFVYPDDDES